MLNMNLAKKKVSEIIVDELIEQIRRGDLKPGQRLPNERDLADSLGVSRMSLREAIQVLHQVGIIESRHGKGNFVSEYTSENVGKALYWYSLLGNAPLLDLIAARRVMESEAARLAAKNATLEDLERIQTAMLEREQLLEQETPETEPDPRRLEAGTHFHRAIAVASHNAVFVHFLSAIEASARKHQEAAARYRQAAPEVDRIHRDIFDAIKAKDPDLAYELMKKHIDIVERAIVGQLEDQDSSEDK